ncbi:hypothetical protein [Duganella violaceipulchra]|uniref:Uncharacterized protein n=1 Tax=Duganella violaceipulchra TaxID=2849652 RepID=A0AA41L5W1_9BURK|nr:hypothetical protein [Duganella violaceicalia]MBV6324639.1 hypothetical protein [Duganella violaceicalia]MCP2009916.1 hypothetical protein [Duganella violaceicalia]
MAQLTVELDDREMSRVESAARARQIDPSHLTGAQLLKVLTSAQPKKAKFKSNGMWVSGGAARLARLKADKHFDVVVVARAVQCAVEIMEKQHQAGLVASAKAASIKTAGEASGAAITGAAARAKRLAAVMSVHGMWKNDPDKPRDAIAYQREVRAEWK